jgi:VIT1/CCC1 family predicted Fe2+/Mn2+ transporter
MIDLRRLSYGGAAGIITSMALINGFTAAETPKATIVGSLLIVAIADNMTDSLSMHIYQESERVSGLDAFRTTLANFLARIVAALSFVALVVLLPPAASAYACIGWGFALLAVLSVLLARVRRASALSEVWKHCAVAAVVIAVSRAIGASISAGMHGA